MPTGYTAKIEDGISFEEFAMGCARGMGACIMMRDEPANTPIPEKFEPSQHHSESIASTVAEIVQVKAMTHNECTAAAEDEAHTLNSEMMRSREDARALGDKYREKLAEIEAWQPPTPDHVGLKDFMREQVESSLKFDCSRPWLEETANIIEDKSAEAWRSARLSVLADSLKYHTEGNAKEIQRAKERTVWVADLRVSLRA